MIAQIKQELEDWFQLIAKREGVLQTAGEKAVQRGIVALHKALIEGEKEAVILTYDTAKKIEALVPEVEKDLKEALAAAIKFVDVARPKSEVKPEPAIVAAPVVPADVPTPVDAPAQA